MFQDTFRSVVIGLSRSSVGTSAFASVGTASGAARGSSSTMRMVTGRAVSDGFVLVAVSTIVSPLSSSASSTTATFTVLACAPGANVTVVAESVKSTSSAAVLAPPMASVATVPPASAEPVRRTRRSRDPDDSGKGPELQSRLRERGRRGSIVTRWVEGSPSTYGAPGAATSSRSRSTFSASRAAFTVKAALVRPAANVSVVAESV